MREEPPVVFVSYSHDSEPHKRWVTRLAARLRQETIRALVDDWEVPPGASFTAYMERIREAEKVVVVMTPDYARKANARKGGVGYEEQIISGDILAGTPREKFIPLLRSGSHVPSEPDCAIPTGFSGAKFIDFRDNGVYNQKVRELLDAISGNSRAPDVLHPSSAAKAIPSHAPGFRADEGFSINALKRAIRQHVDAGYEPAHILTYFMEQGVPRDRVRHVLAKYFGYVIP